MTDASETWIGPAAAPLFSKQATDNAEVVPDDVPRGTDSLWSTATPTDSDEVLIEEDHEAQPGSPWWTSAESDRSVPTGGVFSAEPVDREFDLLDAPAFEQDLEWTEPAANERRGSPLFTNGAQAAEQPPPHEAQSIWRTLEPEPPPVDPTWTGSTPHGPPRAVRNDPDDPNGFERAVARIDPAHREAAAVPLAVCGVLLEPGETVLGAVTGQMLGRPAAVVATMQRVIVANDRRWQPLVDVFHIGSGLSVRGRHDREMAALSFSDDERLSMVDGIADVELAIELADAIRDPSRIE